KGDLQAFDRHASQPNRRAVDDGNVSAIALTGTRVSSDRFHACPRSFTVRPTPMIVSDLSTLTRRQ
ncbi:MAG: hypothetical protein P1U77_21910, partial [Rubripirellula sp.]|nr:hypothetical protein [Rubripirellula sp.]